jgi:hypothetical protein
VTIHLSDEELREVTGYTHRGKQAEALRSMKVPFLINPRGRILVVREKYTGQKPVKKTAPNWEAMGVA